MNNIDGGCRRFILIECEDYAETLTAERVRRVIKGYKFKGTIKTELYSEKLSWNSFEKKHQLITEKINEITEKNAPKYNVITRDIKDGVIQVIGEKTVEELTEGVPGSFTYCILGEAIQVDSLLTGNDMPSFESLARYVFYTATGHSLHSVAKASVDGFIGETDFFRIHLFYQPDQTWLRSNDAALNSDKVKSIVSNNSTKKRTIVFAVAKFMSQKELTAARIEFCQLPYAIHKIMGA
jgi:adenine-specific DNA-methyltransferase